MEEIHLVIIWSKALHKKEEIIKDIEQKFDILEVYSITWSQEKFSENLSRFYGENLPKNSHKERHCGSDTFTCIILKDNNPNYKIRKTGKGDKVVNVNLFDAKQLYRSWTGSGHKIHATDNIVESKLQLVLLLNKTYGSYLKFDDKNIKEKELNLDLVGANGWNSFEDIFNVLNETLNYVILRNFESLEDELNSLHPDVDLLVDNQKLAINILNAKPTTNKKSRVQYNVLIDNKNINFDLRYVGDNYYCDRWARKILNSRVKDHYFFIPDAENYFYSLLYHALLHKEVLSKDYIYRLIDLSKNIGINLKINDFIEKNILVTLDDYIDNQSFFYVEPKDLTVFWNYKLMTQGISIKRKLNNLYLVNIRKIKNKIKSLIK